MLSLSPRYDLFRLVLPKDFLSDKVTEKYTIILNQEPGVIIKPIDYLNESIRSIKIPGISDLIVEQVQHESNPIVREGQTPIGQTLNNINGDGQRKYKLGRINTEPQHTVTYKSTGNPLEKIEREFTVTFRMNQGLYNYYMLYETIFEHFCKDIDKPSDDILYVEILNDEGVICNRIKFIDVHINGIDGLEFSYDKTVRDVATFDVAFKYNNIDFEFLPYTNNKLS